MNIDFEKLNLLDWIVKDLEIIKKQLNSSNSKRWLSTKELSKYLPYSVETINKKVQNEIFICGVHFFQHQKIRMFDKNKIDEWIMNNWLSDKQMSLKEEVLTKMKWSF